MRSDTSLINFRISNNLKIQFDLICKYRCRPRSYVLTALIKKYVETEYPKISDENEIHRKGYENLINFVGSDLQHQTNISERILGYQRKETDFYEEDFLMDFFKND